MEDFPPAPRVNGSLLPKYQGKTVTLVGKVTSTADTSLKLEASDSTTVLVHIMPGTVYPVGQYLEVVGEVHSDNSIQESRIVDFGTSFDMKNYESLVQLANGKFSELFM